MAVTTKILVDWGVRSKNFESYCGGANEKRMCHIYNYIYLSNCLEFTWDFILKNINVSKVSRSYSFGVGYD